MHRLSDYEKALLQKFNVTGTNTESIKHDFMPEDQFELNLFESEEQVAIDLAPPEQAKKNTLFSSRDLLKSCVNKIINRFESDKEFSGLQTNFSDFDDRTQGLQKGDLIIVAGLPTVGKTTFARTIAENVALNSQKNVAIFSLDMPADQMMMQMISSIGKIETHKLQSGYLNKEDWENLPMVISRLKETGIFVDDSEALSPLELRHKMQNLKSYHIELIVIDYFQLMLTDTPTRNHSQEIRETLKELKALAKELDIPVVVLFQLNSKVERRQNKRPKLSDFPESDAVVKYADLILFVYRDECYDPDTDAKGIAEIIIAKQKNGRIGKVLLEFLGQFRRFQDIRKYSSWVDE